MAHTDTEKDQPPSPWNRSRDPFRVILNKMSVRGIRTPNTEPSTQKNTCREFWAENLHSKCYYPLSRGLVAIPKRTQHLTANRHKRSRNKQPLKTTRTDANQFISSRPFTLASQSRSPWQLQSRLILFDPAISRRISQLIEAHTRNPLTGCLKPSITGCCFSRLNTWTCL